MVQMLPDASRMLGAHARGTLVYRHVSGCGHSRGVRRRARPEEVAGRCTLGESGADTKVNRKRGLRTMVRIRGRGHPGSQGREGPSSPLESPWVSRRVGSAISCL